MKTWSFRTSFVVPAPRDRVHDILVDLENYPSWWRQVRAVAKLGEDDALVVCRSALPYSLHLQLHAVHRMPDLLETAIDGDLVGVVRWRLADHPSGTKLNFEQDVRVAGRLLTIGSYVARPLLQWNHDRMMAGCEAGLRSRVDV
jgi:carbon monoxide dehydrogenase subunit G